MELEDQIRGLLASGGEDVAVGAVIQALGPSVLGYLCTLHGDDDGADVFAAWEEDVWKGLPGFRFEAPLRSWAFRIAWHASARFRRDGWAQRRQRLPTSAASRLPAPTTRGGGPRGGDERLEELRRELEPQEHSLLILRLDRELSWEEIAAVLAEEGQPPLASATLRKRFERLKERLTREARRRGLLP